MMPLLSPTPRILTLRSIEQRRGGMIAAGLFVSLALGVIVSGFAAIAPVAIIPAAILMTVGIVVAVVTARQQWIFIHGVEMLAEAELAKSCTLRWEFGGQRHSRQVAHQQLLWEEGRVRIVVDPRCPSRMIVATMEMIPLPPMAACMEGGGASLPTAPRPANRAFAGKQVRGLFVAAAILFSISAGAALVTSIFAAQRDRFLAEATVVGVAKVIGRSSSSVQYEFGGERKSFTASGKAQNRWPVGTGVTVWSRQGRIVAEPDLPGMPRAAAMTLSLLPVAVGAAIFFVAMHEVILRRRLWCHGVEVAATIVSDHAANGQREVVYRYASRGLRGVARQCFGASRRPVTTANGWHVTALACGRESRLVLSDEAW